MFVTRDFSGNVLVLVINVGTFSDVSAFCFLELFISLLLNFRSGEDNFIGCSFSGEIVLGSFN